MAARPDPSLRGEQRARLLASLALVLFAPGAAAAARPGHASPVILLLRASTTAAHFAAMPGAHPGAYDATIEHWEQRLRGLGYAVTRIDEQALAELGDRAGTHRDRVLVAPSAAALDDTTLERLLAAVAQGHGLVASWQLALYGAAGTWRGFGPLETLLGAAPLPDAASPEPVLLRWVTLHAGAAVTAGLPAGARLQIQPFDTPLPLAASSAVADFTRWELLPFGSVEHPIRPTAIAQARHGKGRVVWLNFEPRALVPHGAGARWLDRLVANAVAWAAGLPLAEVESWPGGARFAAMVGLDTEQDFAVGAEVARRFAGAAMPLTAFAVSSLAGREPQVVRELARAGEVGSHTDDHRPLAGRPLLEQLDQLQRSRAILSELAGQQVVGFRPPEEQVDAATFVAAVRAGYEYLAGTADKDRAVPHLRRVDGRTLVVLPRIPLDDYEFAVRTSEKNPAVVAATVRRDLEQLRRLGGLWLFDFHTQYARAPLLADALDAVLAVRQMPEAWAATGRDIATWWRSRTSVTALARGTRGARGVTLRIAGGPMPVEQLSIRVHLPPEMASVRVHGDAAGCTLAPVGPEVVRLNIPALEAHARRTVTLVPVAPAPPP